MYFNLQTGPERHIEIRIILVFPVTALRHPPSGGCSMSPFLSQVPIGWMSNESTSRQKSLVLSLPSRRRRSRVPIMPITVAIHTELELRGSRASSFIPALKSLEGGTLDCRGIPTDLQSSLLVRGADAMIHVRVACALSLVISLHCVLSIIKITAVCW